MTLNEHLDWIRASLPHLLPEYMLVAGIALVIVAGLIERSGKYSAPVALIAFVASLAFLINGICASQNLALFHGMILADGFSAYFKILFAISGILTIFMSRHLQAENSRPEYYALILAAVLGANLLAMSTNFLMTFVSLELISISSYVLAGFAFTRTGTEGSLKYFLFGSVASAIMVYGFSILYGLTGTLEFFSTDGFLNKLPDSDSPLVLTSLLMAMSGFLFKIAAVPMHPWAPDVYEAAPIPVIAFFSIVPKLAGVAALTKFSMGLEGRIPFDWQIIVGVITLITIAAGNFSALMQKSAKRMMAYSSIAQSGFLLVGIVAFGKIGIDSMLFYAAVFMIMNYLVFIYLQYFENLGITSIAGFAGIGRGLPGPSILLLAGLIALTGLPPTAGFTGKLFVFSSLWAAYQITHKTILLALLTFGLLNTVVSLFFYLKIPYYSFLKTVEVDKKQNILTFENLLGLILVLALVVLFFRPGLLMGWINNSTFVK